MLTLKVPYLRAALLSASTEETRYYLRGVQILRLVERYADYGQVGYLAFHRHDARLIDAGTHPVKVLQMHS